MKRIFFSYKLIAFLEYIYSNQVKLDNKLAMDLFILANKWRYVELERVCEQYLVENLSMENVLEVSSIANSLEIERLGECVLDFIIKNTDRLKENGDLCKFEYTILVDVLLKLGENMPKKK